MNGLAGILRHDDGSATAEAVEQMAATMPHRDLGDSVAVDGPVALTGAVASADGRLLVTFAGRLDEPATSVPATAVLEAYERSGTAGFSRLIGDFALALWDGHRQELICARDALGRRPLYVQRGPGAVRFASEPQAVLADPRIPRRPNLGMLGEHLAGAVRSTSETLIEGLERLPPAHLLRVTRDGTVSVERYWSWDPQAALALTDEEAVEQFRHTFREAVRARLDPGRVTAVELSGGLDSSAVTAAAASLAQVDAYSLVLPGDPGDESAFIQAAATHLGLTPFTAAPQPAGADLYLAQIETHLDLPEPPNMAMHRALHAEVARRGQRVVLTGKGADEWFSGSPFDYADRLRRLQLRGLRKAAAAQEMVWPSSSPVHQLVRDGLLPLAPSWVELLVRRRSGRTGAPPWLGAAFCHEIDLLDRLQPRPLRGPRLASAAIASTLDDGWAMQVAESSERSLARFGLEARSPFEDRRLIELALALPERMRQRDGHAKWLVRAANEDVLPPEVLRVRRQVGFRGVLVRELEAQGGGELFEGLRIAELGWVDGPFLRRGYDAFVARHQQGLGHPLAWPLWNALSVERWTQEII